MIAQTLLLQQENARGLAPDKLHQLVKHGVRPRRGQRRKRAVDGDDFIIRPALTRLRKQRQRVAIATLVRIKRNQAVGDFRALRVQLAWPEIAALRLRQFSELQIAS